MSCEVRWIDLVEYYKVVSHSRTMSTKTYSNENRSFSMKLCAHMLMNLIFFVQFMHTHVHYPPPQKKTFKNDNLFLSYMQIHSPSSISMKMQSVVWLHFTVYSSWRLSKKTFLPSNLEVHWAVLEIVINARLQQCQIMPCRTLVQLLLSWEASNHKDILI